MTRIDKKVLLTEIDKLVVSTSISDKERSILLKAKFNLEKDIYYVIVANTLRISLTFYAMGNKLSDVIKPLYSELLRQFPGRESGIPIWYNKK